jgi:hypothetical protein
MSTSVARRRLGEAGALVSGVRHSNQVLAALVILLIGLRIQLPQGLTVGYVAAAVLMPVWLPALRRYLGATALLSVGALCLASGLWLNEASRATHTVDAGETASTILSFAGILCSIGFVLWARGVLPVSWIGIWFGLGLLGGVSASGTLFTSNPWRFGFSFGFTVLLLSMAMLTRRRWLELTVAFVLTAVAMFTDARSSFALLFLTAIFIAWQLRPARPTRAKSSLRVVIALVALAVVVYNLAEDAIVAGYFGEATRERTVAQLQQSGSLIVGGRPELTATLALMDHQPWGFGAGTLLNPDDVLAAKSGMAEINYDPNNGYVENYMFGGHIELHSIFGDLWAHFGIPGLIFAGLATVLILRGVGLAVSNHAASSILIFLSVNTLWAMLFGPLYSASRMLIIVLALSLLPKEAPDPPGPPLVQAGGEARARRFPVRGGSLARRRSAPPGPSAQGPIAIERRR